MGSLGYGIESARRRKKMVENNMALSNAAYAAEHGLPTGSKMNPWDYAGMANRMAKLVDEMKMTRAAEAHDRAETEESEGRRVRKSLYDRFQRERKK